MDYLTNFLNRANLRQGPFSPASSTSSPSPLTVSFSSDLVPLVRAREASGCCAKFETVREKDSPRADKIGRLIIGCRRVISRRARCVLYRDGWLTKYVIAIVYKNIVIGRKIDQTRKNIHHLSHESEKNMIYGYKRRLGYDLFLITV